MNPDPGHILVVDDSATILKVVSAILERRGFSTTLARDGVDALQKVEENGPFDLVLVDFVMPRMNGFQFCRELRRDRRRKSLPVILMSAKSDRIKQQFVEQTGALDAISKPFDARTLVAVIEGVLAKARAKAARPPLELDLETMDDEPSESSGALSRRSLAGWVQGDDPVTAMANELASGLSQPAETSAEELRAALGRVPAHIFGDALAMLHPRTKEIFSGDLASVSLAEIMQLLQMQKQSGALVVTPAGEKGAPRAVRIYFRDGLVDFGSSTRAEFRLGRYFVEAGALDRKALEQYAAQSRERNRRIGDELVLSGVVNEESRTAALVRQTSEVVYDLVRWQAGRFAFVKDETSEEAARARLGLGVPGLVFEGFRRVDEWRLMEGSIVWDEVIVIDETARLAVKESLSRPEQLVLAAVDGVRSVEAIVGESELARFDALKVLYQLKSSRVLRAAPPVGRRSEQTRPVDESTTEHGDEHG